MTGIIFALILYFLSAMPAFAAVVTETAPAGNTPYVFTLGIDVDESRLYAGIQFSLTINGGTVTFDSFEVGGNINGAMMYPFIERNGIYSFGFYTGSNTYQGNMNVGTLKFTYTGNENSVITVTEMKIAHYNENGSAEWLRTENNVITVNVARESSGSGNVTSLGSSENSGNNTATGDSGENAGNDNMSDDNAGNENNTPVNEENEESGANDTLFDSNADIDVNDAAQNGNNSETDGVNSNYIVDIIDYDMPLAAFSNEETADQITDNNIPLALIINEETVNENITENKKIPNTGDSGNFVIFVLLGISLISAGITLRFKTKK